MTDTLSPGATAYRGAIEAAQRRQNPPDRFWSKVDKSGECWLWTASVRSNGYGSFGFDGRTVYAHRFAYQLLVEEIPPGLQLDHLCRVRHCVNPAHLEVVTQQENIRRGEGPSGQNARKTHCPKGHPYDEVNTRFEGTFRHCRECRRISQRTPEYRASRRVDSERAIEEVTRAK